MTKAIPYQESKFWNEYSGQTHPSITKDFFKLKVICIGINFEKEYLKV